MNRKELKVSMGALRLVDSAETGHIKFADAKKDGNPSFRMVGYSGGIIKNHWYWGNLGIDLSGMKFDKKTFPILRDHNTNREIGFSKKPNITDEGMLFTDKEVTLLDNPESQAFKKNAAEGFPYQASIYAVPSVIERVEEGESVEVNGHVLKGPGTVWRKATFKECSVCVFGHDDQTSAQVFSQEAGEEVQLSVESIGENTGHGKNNNNDGGVPMDLKKFQKEHPDLFSQIVEDTTKSVTDKLSEDFQKKLDEKDSEIASLKSEKTKLSEEMESVNNRVLQLEKRDLLREEKALDAIASAIWDTKLSESEIPENLYGKIRAHVTRKKFMKESGEFDKEAFSEAVLAEIADWQKELSSEPVQGLGLQNRTVDGSEGDINSMSADSVANRMLGHIGQKPTGDNK